MAAEPLSALPAQTGAAVADNDAIETLDVSDTTSVPESGPGGTSKKLLITQLVVALKARLALTGADVAAITTPVNASGSPHTLVAGEVCIVDSSAGPVTVNYPAVVADGAAFTVVLAVAGNAVTVNRGASDVFNAPGGGTSKTLSVAGQVLQTVYESSLAVHEVIDEPSRQFDPGYGTTPNTSVANRLSVDVQIDVQDYTPGTYTWNAPSWTTANSTVEVWVVGAGGQGGGGSRGATSTVRGGGGGGASGNRSQAVFLVGDLTAPITVTVGAGGTGANGATVDGNGGNGQAGGDSSFGKYVFASGGGGGQGGQQGTDGGNGGTPGLRGLFAGVTGGKGGGVGNAAVGLGSYPTVAGTNGSTAASTSGSGGGGGGFTASNTNAAPAAGGEAAAYLDGSVVGGPPSGGGGITGGNGTPAAFLLASGGGGGFRGNGQNGSTGGAGSTSAGGAGGGAALSPSNGGNGGNGGAGRIRVITRP